MDSYAGWVARLEAGGYLLSQAERRTVYLACRREKPVLVEGPPGCGKTALAGAVAAAEGAAVIRLQCYAGITADKAIGRFDESLQALYLRTRSGEQDFEWAALRERLHALEFFTLGPLAAAILAPRRVVLLIDEVDKVTEEFEAFLLEVLSEWQISVPKLGTVRHVTRPVAILTSNETRRLGDPLRRRCLYLRMEYPEIEREARILRMRSRSANTAFLAGFAQALRGWRLEKPPSIAEMVELGEAIEEMGIERIEPGMREELLPWIAKTAGDRKRLCLRDGFEKLIADAERDAAAVPGSARKECA